MQRFHRPSSPLPLKQENVIIVPRSKSPVVTKQYIQNTKFYNRFNRYQERFRQLQEEIDREIKEKANCKKISENSYKIIAHYLEQRIASVFDILSDEVTFAQLGRVFTVLTIFDEVVFDENCELKVKNKIKISSRAQSEIMMHDQFWSLVSHGEIAEKKLIQDVLRTLLDPIKFSVQETAEMLLELLELSTDNVEEAKKLVTLFRTLTQNKLFTIHNDKKQQFQIQQKELALRELTFTPNTNPTSMKLANTHRAKYVDDPQDADKIHFFDLVDVRYEEYKEKKQQYEDLNEFNIMKECTFKPKINVQTYMNDQNIVERLYQQEEVVGRTQRLKERDEYLKEQKLKKEQDKCTFHPKINEGIPQMYLQILQRTPRTPKDFDRTVGRMKFANEIKAQKKEQMDYVPSGQNYEKVKSQQFKPPQLLSRQKKSRKQIIVMDVTIQPGREGRLALYDDEDPQEVVNKFATLFKLNDELKDTLFNVLQQEMRKYQQKQ